MDEEVGLIFALNPRQDFSALQQRLIEKRTDFKERLRRAYAVGEYSPGLVALWTDVHAKARVVPADEDKDIADAVQRVKEWITQLNTYKKSSLSDPGRIREYRVLLRKVRYALDSMGAMIPKRAVKAASGLKKVQDEFGMLCDVSQHIEMLHHMAAESGDAEFAYYCGVCAGIFSGCQQEIHREALGVWKDYRSDIRSLEDAL